MNYPAAGSAGTAVAVLPPVIFTLQLMTRHDDMVFRLLGIRWLFRLRVRQRALHGGMWVFSPLEPRRPE